jgi:hypothetical protein
MTAEDTHVLNAQSLLNIWELGQIRRPVRRALLLLCAACPDQNETSLAGLCIGRRDTLLFQFYQQMFGPRLNAAVTCPACGVQLEFSLLIPDLLQLKPADDPLEITHGEWRLRFRLPTSSDLIVLEKGEVESTPAFPIPDLTSPPPITEPPSIAYTQLAKACLVEAFHEGVPSSASSVPAEALADLPASMSAADPLAEVILSTTCPACAHQWPILLDIASFLWVEIEDIALHLLEEVHTLACAYGWREAEILALSAQRRRWYMERVSNE